jgi:hypothetical protein
VIRHNSILAAALDMLYQRLNDLGIGVDEWPVRWISVAAADSVRFVTSDWSVTVCRPETGAFCFAPLASCFLPALLSPPGMDPNYSSASLNPPELERKAVSGILLL